MASPQPVNALASVRSAQTRAIFRRKSVGDCPVTRRNMRLKGVMEAKPASKPDPKPDATPEKAAATPKEGSRAPAEPKARPARSARGSRRRNA